MKYCKAFLLIWLIWFVFANGCNLLALIGIFLAFVGAKEEFSIEQLDRDHSEDEVEEEVDDQDVEHVFQGVDDAVEDGLQFGNPLDGLQRPEDAKDSQRLHRAQVLTAGTPPVKKWGRFCVEKFFW